MIDTLVWMLVAASLVPAHQAARRHSAQHLVALLCLELIGVAMVLVAALDEPRWSALAQEDGPVEWITFSAFTLAAGILALRVRKLGGRWFAAASVLLALFCVVVAGEEISWGQRLLGFRPPDVFLDRNFQQELNVHNVLMHERGLGFSLESKHLVMAIALGFSLAWPLLVRWGWLRAFSKLAPPWSLLPVGLAIVAAEQSYPVDLTGEGAEMMCGLLFLAAALLPLELPTGRLAGWLGIALASGLIISLAVARLVFGSDDAGRAHAAAELELLRADVSAGAAQPRLFGRNIHKRVFTAARDGYLAFAGRAYLEQQGTPAEPAPPPLRVRRDRRGYFLDPWNNPYWVVFDRRTRACVVYSFGPNRRRDLSARALHEGTGDDVVVRFALPPAPDAAPAP
ncbi:MAG TPA: hypothetical protein PKU97_11950, partial [Kofleriaceae bacterium]|nr:hypothetical protein [Kofleriaceae bacterium]